MPQTVSDKLIVDLAAADQEGCVGMPEPMRCDPRHSRSFDIKIKVGGQALTGKRSNVAKDEIVRREAVLPAFLGIAGPQHADQRVLQIDCTDRVPGFRGCDFPPTLSGLVGQSLCDPAAGRS